jgi:uncharacterized cupin superfamily protein
VSVPEARLKQTDAGLVPEGHGWFVLNARDAAWWRSDELGQATTFEGEAHFPELGIHVEVLMPGQRNCMYHGESRQEGFLVLSGECIAILEGEERRLMAWDFVHCPPWTEHAFVGTGEGPCVIVMAGSRASGFDVVYPVSEVAARHGASVEEEATSPDAANAAWSKEKRTFYKEGWLP